MDAFESVVSEILWRDGYWVQNAVKVELTKEEKSRDRSAIVAAMGARRRRLQRETE